MTPQIDLRLQRLLGGAALAGLRQRLRQRFERVPTGEALASVRLGALSDAENAALAALLGRAARGTGSMQVDVARIDAALQRAGVATSLRDALEQLDGPLLNTSAERERIAARWKAVIGGCAHPQLAAWLATRDGSGLLRRLSGRDEAIAERSLLQAQAVLDRLPASGSTRAQLAARVLGDAHALDAGKVVATLVLSALRQAAPASDDAAADAAISARELWAGVGVLVNELARPALCLNLPTESRSTLPAGEPVYLSLRTLLRSPLRWAVAGRHVHVCENPNLLAIAADALGERCAPLVCTDGMPAAAQRSLLTQLTRAGARLHVHADFDWPGLHIVNHLIRAHAAQPWRFGSSDYLAAASQAARPGRALSTAQVAATWDDNLSEAMRREGLAIDEEAVADSLLQDLAA